MAHSRTIGRYRSSHSWIDAPDFSRLLQELLSIQDYTKNLNTIMSLVESPRCRSKLSNVCDFSCPDAFCINLVLRLSRNFRLQTIRAFLPPSQRMKMTSRAFFEEY